MFTWGMFYGWVSTVVGVLYLIAVLTTIVVVILDNRNPVKTLSWVLILSFLPLVGLVLYFFFGRDVRKEKLIGKKGYVHLVKHPMNEFQRQRSFTSSEEEHPAMRFFYHVSNALPFAGNHMEVYTSGNDMLQALLEAIASARHHIHMEFYIFEDDEVGQKVCDALAQKAKEGVEVRFLYDDVGCWKLPNRFVESMLEEGIEARSFLKVRFPHFTSKVNYRNHRKITVIDGCIGFVGGMNIARRYLEGVSWGRWADVHLRIEGKAVYGLQTAFLIDWFAVDRSLITSSKYYPEMSVKGEAVMQIVTSDPVGEWRDMMQGLLLVITSARKYLYIQTPYLLPTEPVLWALKTVALAGVDVRIMIPSRADSWITHLASLSYIGELMEAGVKIYFYERGFLHSKLWVCDDNLSTVGSTNMDFRSFEHNFEVNAFMYDRASAVALKEVFLNDQKDALLLATPQWKRRPWYQKVGESVIRLFAPLL
ncbi:MAG: cardiolipin synthase [Bacteroides sp.]|nr:cardiolipin synthase [Bacteroides sp.]